MHKYLHIKNARKKSLVAKLVEIALTVDVFDIVLSWCCCFKYSLCLELSREFLSACERFILPEISPLLSMIR